MFLYQQEHKSPLEPYIGISTLHWIAHDCSAGSASLGRALYAIPTEEHILLKDKHQAQINVYHCLSDSPKLRGPAYALDQGLEISAGYNHHITASVITSPLSPSGSSSLPSSPLLSIPRPFPPYQVLSCFIRRMHERMLRFVLSNGCMFLPALIVVIRWRSISVA
jgi:hypothetical protein